MSTVDPQYKQEQVCLAYETPQGIRVLRTLRVGFCHTALVVIPPRSVPELCCLDRVSRKKPGSELASSLHLIDIVGGDLLFEILVALSSLGYLYC